MSISESSPNNSNGFEFMISRQQHDDHRCPETMAFADELFHGGRLLPLPPRLQTRTPVTSSYKPHGFVLRWSFSSLSSFKKDVDPFMAAAELVKKEDMPWIHHHRAMSMDQPFITSSSREEVESLKYLNMNRKKRIIGSLIESKVSNGLRLVKDEVRVIVSMKNKQELESTRTTSLVHHDHQRIGKPEIKKKIMREATITTPPCTNLFGCFRSISMSHQ
ncbi:hypothetical protein J5N97_016622 [Dioscorea zingiberensis]|uniref:Uncharacterized protein n=1 Tax=Dioscorea zingiberensis TaxID=325984 RepID=A0A9D5HFU7_9LILI|nr:hypothetical protein J5N97_016622 [Dioscorea zingiberensis]